MSQLPIGNIGQPFRAKDLHDLLHDLAAKQEVAEQLVISARTGIWHARISKLRRVTSQKTRDMLRSMARYVAEDLGRDKEKDPLGFRAFEDSGSILVEDLRLYGPKKLSERWDVVVSWGASREELAKEIDSIRSCLDALGIFDDTERQVQDLAGSAETWVGNVQVKEDRVNHERTVSGKLNVSRILAAVGHVIPGVSKLELGGTVKTQIPYEDSREKFIAALLALQWQSNGQLSTCEDLQKARNEWQSETFTAEDLQERWENEVLPAKRFLQTSLQAIDRELRPAFSVHPVGQKDEMYYDSCLRGLELGDYQRSINILDRIQHSGLPIQRAMGENFYLFAANVIMQAQIAWFERDLEDVLQKRFGQTLRRDASVSAQRSRTPTPDSSPGCGPAALSQPHGQMRPRRPRP